MSLVLDTSATLAFLLDDERDAATASLYETISINGAFVPSLWPYEVANSLSVAVKRGRISTVMRSHALMKLRSLDIVIDRADFDEIWNATVALADLYQLTVYDAAYLELAQRMRAPLATLDDSLMRACKASAVHLAI